MEQAIMRPFFMRLRLWQVMSLVAICCLLPHNAGAMPKIQTFQSPQGQPVWLIQDASVPLVAVNLTWRGAGSATDPADKLGLASMAASLLTEGAGDMDATQFYAELEEKAIRLSFSSSRDSFSVSLQSLNAHLDAAARLANLAFTQPRFEAAAISRVREQMKTGIAYREQTPSAQAEEQWWAVAFAGHPYSKTPDGTRETLDRITATDLRRFLADGLAHDNLIVSVAGDIGAEQAGVVVDRLLQGLPAKASERTRLPDDGLSHKGQVAVTPRPLPQSVAVFGQEGIARQDPDYYAALIVNYVLGGGGFSSRLMEEIREKRGLTYGIGTGLVSLQGQPLLMGQVSSETAKMPETLRLLRQVMADIKAKGITAEELKNAKDYLNGSFPLELDGSRKLAGLLNSMQYFGLPPEFLQQRAQLIEQVTLEQANAVAAKLLQPDQLVITIVGNPALETTK